MTRLSSLTGDYTRTGMITDRRQYVAVGGETEYELVFIDDAEEVYINGARKFKGTDYTTDLVRGMIVLTDPLVADDELILVGRANANDIPFTRSATESVVLTSGQTEVIFNSISTKGLEVYISGPLVDKGKLWSPQDYELRSGSDSIIDLTGTYPAGTVIEGVEGGRLTWLDADDLFVNDGTSSKTISSRFAATQESEPFLKNTTGSQIQPLTVGLTLRRWLLDNNGLASTDNDGDYPMIRLGKAYWLPGEITGNDLLDVISWTQSDYELTINVLNQTSSLIEQIKYYRMVPLSAAVNDIADSNGTEADNARAINELLSALRIS